MYAGFVDLEDTIKGALVTRDGNDVPTAPTGLPTFAVYGPDGAMLNGSGNCTKLDTPTGLYEYAIAALSSNGYEVGPTYRVFMQYVVGGVTYAEVDTFTVT